jgi:hypothetical protein
MPRAGAERKSQQYGSKSKGLLSHYVSPLQVDGSATVGQVITFLVTQTASSIVLMDQLWRIVGICGYIFSSIGAFSRRTDWLVDYQFWMPDGRCQRTVALDPEPPLQAVRFRAAGREPCFLTALGTQSSGIGQEVTDED